MALRKGVVRLRGGDRSGPVGAAVADNGSRRFHWHIENRLHYVRDFTYDEDRCQVYVRDLLRNLAALTNNAISIIRGLGQFAFVPEENRHFAARSQEALDLPLHPPG